LHASDGGVGGGAPPPTSGWELPVWARGGRMWAELSAALEYRNSTANYYTQQLDHANSSRGVFQQKYYVDASHYEPSNKMA
jgi:hypothetical protein